MFRGYIYIYISRRALTIWGCERRKLITYTVHLGELVIESLETRELMNRNSEGNKYEIV